MDNVVSVYYPEYKGNDTYVSVSTRKINKFRLLTQIFLLKKLKKEVTKYHIAHSRYILRTSSSVNAS